MPARWAHTPETFAARIGASIDRHRLAGADAAILVATSGGADSVALLAALADLARNPQRRYRLCVGHLDHGLRDDSPADAQFIADLADSLGLPLIAERIDVAAAAEAGEGLEAAARRVRYGFLARAARQADCTRVATAHHADDNVETVLHRILRGTGIDGLAGIRRSRALGGDDLTLIRPMLDVARTDVEAFLTDRGIAWRTDHTNADTRHTRNRIRHDLLPLLRRDYNPQVDAAIGRLSQAAAWAEQALARVTDQALSEAIVEAGDDEIVVAIDAINAQGAAVGSRIIRAAMVHIGANMQRVGMDHVQRALDLASQPSGTGRLDLPDGLTVERRYDDLVIRTGCETAPPPEHTHAVHWPGRTILADGSVLDVTLDGNVDLGAFIASKDAREEMLNADAITPPVTVRRWTDGDRFTPLGGSGTQKLSDFFGSARVHAEARRRAWVLTDATGIVWVAPYRIDDRVRISEATVRVARVRWAAAPDGMEDDV